MSLYTCQIYRMKIKSELQCKLWTLCDEICHYRLIDCDKCTTLLRETDNGGGSLRTKDIWELCISAQCCCELKTSLKNKAY